MRTSAKTAAAILVGVLAIACSNGGEATNEPLNAASDAPALPQSTASPSVTGQAARRVDPRNGGLDLTFGEYAITLEAAEIRPGRVEFVIRNGGTMIHGFEIEARDDDGDHSGPGHGELKLEGPAFDAGETIRITADLPPGIYEIECFVAEHDDLGMRTTLVVREDAPMVPADRSPTSDSVEIAEFSFSPDVVDVEPGAEVTWRNDDPTAHTVTAEDGSFDSGTIEPSDGFAQRFMEPGTYTYFCQIHPTMRASVRVATT